MISKNRIITLALLTALIGVTTWRYSKQVSKVQEPVAVDTLIIGTNAEYPPFSYMKDGQIVGFDIDVAVQVANRLGKSYRFKDMPFDALIPEIQLGLVHMIAAGMTPTSTRAKTVYFATPHFDNDSLVIVSPINKPISTVADLSGKNVVVNEGFTADTYVSALQGPIINRLLTTTDAIVSLQTGRADAFVTAQSSINPFLANQKEKTFNVVIIPDTQERVALAISQKYPEIYKQIDTAVQQMIEDGTIETIKKKWNL